MKIVRDILGRKGYEIYAISPDASVFEALQIMASKEIGALLVMENEKVVGILSERDYARKVVLMGRTSKDAPVRDIMTTRVLYITPERNVDNCMSLMIDKRVRHLPVVENDKVVGLISIGDVVKAIIADKENVIQELEQYITGSY